MMVEQTLCVIWFTKFPQDKSPDLTPPDFTLWGFMKQMGFFHLPDYVKDLSKTLTNAAAKCHTWSPT